MKSGAAGREIESLFEQVADLPARTSAQSILSSIDPDPPRRSDLPASIAIGPQCRSSTTS